jgi:16S rRNA (guanine527-N7)-methyltransferase
LTHPREPLPAHADDLPPLPPSYDEALDDGLRAINLTLAPAVRHAIDDHVRLLMAWNEAINLTAIREPAQIARQHVLDSLAAVAVARELGAPRLLDLGSGGGFPGLPLALAIPAQALLVDSVAKKTRFLETVVSAVGARASVSVATTRAEALAADPGHRARWPLVTARAVASLADLIELAWPLLEVGGHLVAWKRSPMGDELEAAGRAIATLEGHGAPNRGAACRRAQPSQLDVRTPPGPVPGLEGHVLVVATKRQRVPSRYPRSPAQRKRQPW